MNIFNSIHRMLCALPPTVLGAFALMNGILCQLTHRMWLMSIFCIGAGELLHRIQNWPRLTAWLMMIVLSCCGALRFASQQAQQLTTAHTIPYGLCTIKGTIVKVSPSTNAYYPHNIKLLTQRILPAHNPKKVVGSPIMVQIAIQKDMPLYTQGDVIELSHVALFKETSLDKEQYLVKNKLHCTGKATKQCTIQLIEERATGISQRFYSLRESILNAARECFSSKTFILISEMFFGYPAFHEKNHRSIRELFSWWGLNHLLARSGLHLVMFILLFGFLLSKIPLPFLYKHALILIIIFLYMLLSWPSISFIRAVAMMTWYALCIGLWSAPHPLHIIACITIGVLLYQPWYLMSLDFQLSFALTFALAIMSHAAKITK